MASKTKETPKKKTTNKKEEVANSNSKIIKREEIKNMIKKTKDIPKEELEKIHKVIFKNIIIALCIIAYFIFLNLGQINIQNDVYVTDLKVFSVCVLLTAIAFIENAYKKDSGEIAIYGIEMIVLAISTVALIYVNMMFPEQYISIATLISYAFGIYYVFKSIVIYIRKKNQYFVNDMKEIMNKEDDE